MKVYPEAVTLIESLGLRASSREAESILSSLGTVTQPSLEDDGETQHYDWVLVRRKGIELGFVDRMYFEAQPEHKWGDDENLILNQLTFYAEGARDEVKGWTDELPYGLTFSDTRITSRQKLSAHAPTLRSGTRDRWDIDDRRLIVTYFPDDRGIENVHIKLGIKPWSESGREQPQLNVQQWVNLFGLHASDARFVNAVSPLDIQERIEDEEDDREVGFLRECGVELYFESRKRLRLPPTENTSSSGLVFAAVKFFRARDREARQWSGELPLNLSFDDSIDVVIDALKTPPVACDEGATTGYALWHCPDFSLHVLYSSIENHLLRITMMAPGYWQDRE